MKYYVTGTLDESVQTILEGGGAKKTAYLSGINTHCIVGADPDYNEVGTTQTLTCSYLITYARFQNQNPLGLFLS